MANATSSGLDVFVVYVDDAITQLDILVFGTIDCPCCSLLLFYFEISFKILGACIGKIVRSKSSTGPTPRICKFDRGRARLAEEWDQEFFPLFLQL